MSKKNDAAYDSFLADLKAINPQIEEILKDEKVSAKLKEGVLARADYSRNMDEFREAQTAFAAEVQEARQKIQGWQNWYGETSKQVAGIQGKLKAYQDAYGELDDTDRRRIAKEQGMTPEQFETRLQDEINRRDIANLKFADDLTDIKIDYKDRFKEKLDTTAVFELAGKRGTDLITAYNDYIADRVREADDQALKARIKQEREDAVKEYASQHNLPIVDTRSDVTHTLDFKDAPKNQHDRVAAALAGLAGLRR